MVSFEASPSFGRSKDCTDVTYGISKMTAASVPIRIKIDGTKNDGRRIRYFLLILITGIDLVAFLNILKFFTIRPEWLQSFQLSLV